MIEQTTDNGMGRALRAGLAGLLLLAGVGSAAPPVLAQSNDVRALSDTVRRLERQLQTLERTVYRGESPPASASVSAGEGASGSVSELQVQTGALGDQVRQLTGQVEELDHRIRQVSSRLDKLAADVDFRLQALEQGGIPASPGEAGQGGSPGQAPREGTGRSQTMQPEGAPGPVGVIGSLPQSRLQNGGGAGAPGGGSDGGQGGGASRDGGVQQASAPADLPAGSAAEQYEYARGFLIRRDFDGAAAAFRAFVDANPEDKLAGNAQYWLGETHYVRGDYAEAARTFAEGFQKYPDSSKAPDNLLKLGMSLGALDRTEDACITLSKLRGEYPDAPTSIVQRADREIQRLKCN